MYKFDNLLIIKICIIIRRGNFHVRFRFFITILKIYRVSHLYTPLLTSINIRMLHVRKFTRYVFVAVYKLLKLATILFLVSLWIDNVNFVLFYIASFETSLNNMLELNTFLPLQYTCHDICLAY